MNILSNSSGDINLFTMEDLARSTNEPRGKWTSTQGNREGRGLGQTTEPRLEGAHDTDLVHWPELRWPVVPFF